ncbi:hypothetical protein Patl1_28192 [Pistacia atlantica]|uniref:Uncharacterized protein n=1 Tax=Pistacia atlantica TaxID=434234 RepID=A0ACC1BDA3_9ROSI|nr:hypothetical protein Patl1_28192 [Pistacia atlantica]
MLGDAEDYDTRIGAQKALAALSGLDEVVGALHRVGAISVIKSTPRSSDGAILFLGPLQNPLRLISRNTSQVY